MHSSNLSHIPLPYSLTSSRLSYFGQSPWTDINSLTFHNLARKEVPPEWVLSMPLLSNLLLMISHIHIYTLICIHSYLYPYIYTYEIVFWKELFIYTYIDIIAFNKLCIPRNGKKSRFESCSMYNSSTAITHTTLWSLFLSSCGHAT